MYVTQNGMEQKLICLDVNVEYNVQKLLLTHDKQICLDMCVTSRPI